MLFFLVKIAVEYKIVVFLQGQGVMISLAHLYI